MENSQEITSQDQPKNQSSRIILILTLFSLFFIVLGIAGYLFQRDRVVFGEFSPFVDEDPTIVKTEKEVAENTQGLDFSELVSQSELSEQYYAVTDFNQADQEIIDLTMVPIDPQLAVIKGQEAIAWGSGASGLGSSDPLSSPDLKKVAYLDKNNKLHLSSADRVVDVLVSEDIMADYISGWSNDSNKLIFHANAETLESKVFPQYPGAEMVDEVKLDGLEVESGFYLLDIQNNKLVNLSSLGNFHFESWIDNNRILIKLGDYNNEKFVIFDFSNYMADIKTMNDGLERDFGTQIDFNSDGKKWALTWHGGTNETTSASIILADFPNVEGEELMKADFAQIQGPTISPDGTKVAFRGYDYVNGPLSVYLYDGESVGKVADGFPRRWVNNNQFIYLMTSPGYASNPRMGQNLYLYDTNSNESTLIYEFTQKEN